ncbi:hypothetical protein NA636_23570, partial [Salmonella sp. NW369]
ILRGVRQQQDEPGRFSICSRQAAVVLVRIRAVESRPDTIRRQRTDRPGGKVSDRQYDRQMAHWLLSRPAGGDTAKLAAWQAACPVREASC